MKLYLLSFVLMFGNAYAGLERIIEGPFGPVNSKSITNGGDQSGCAAEEIIEREFDKTNVDFVEGNAPYKWDCQGSKPSQKCPLKPEVLASKEKVECYSNTKDGPAVCVWGSSHKMVNETYGRQATESGSAEFKNARARFKGMVVIKKDIRGYSQTKEYQMDSEGCQVEKAYDKYENGSTVDVDFDKCSEIARSMLGGGVMPFSEKDRYCDTSRKNESRYINSNLSAVRSLAKCMELIPNFEERYSKSLNGSSASSSSSSSANKK